MTPVSAKTETRQEFRGIHFLLCMIAFFGVIIAVNITMAVLASKSWTGLVVKNSYVASQNYNDELEQAKSQREQGLKSHIAYAQGALHFELLDRNGTKISPQHVQIEIGRPAFEQSDQVFKIEVSDDGSYTLNKVLERGIWVVTITAQTEASQYRRDARFLVGADGTGILQ